MTAQSSKTVAVVGAGIVGLNCALSLQRSGVRVTLIDRDDPGRACSFGNAGFLASTECAPLGMPGIWREIPKYVLNRKGSPAISPAALPGLVPFGLRLLRESRHANVERIAGLIQAFYGSSVERYRSLLGALGAPHLLRPGGYICVYPDRRAAVGSAAFWDLHRRHGVEIREIGATDIHEMAPALARGFGYGLHIPTEWTVTDPYGVSLAILQAFQQLGGTLQRQTVRRVGPLGDTVQVVTGAETATFDAVVIAAGVRSGHFARETGHRVLLEPMRGYHAMIADPGIALELPVLSGGHSFIATPMRHGLRIVGEAEFSRLGAAPDDSRIDRMVQAAQALFPGLRADRFDRWMGERPATPDSLPVVGRSPRHRNLYFAFGHGHLGLSGGPMTGEIIAKLVTGQAPAIEIAPYSIARF